MASEVKTTPTLPLNNEWVLWFNGPRQSGTSAHRWEKRYKKVTNFNTVQDFWRIFNNLKVPSELKVGSDYHLFQAGIEPEWEHPKHLGGGAWTFRTHAKDPPAQIDYVWFQVLLSLIGNTFKYGEYVTGIVVSVRKGGMRIAIWLTKVDPRSPTNQEIGEQFKRFVSCQANKKVTFAPFDDTWGRAKDLERTM